MLIKVNVSTDIFELPKVKWQFDDIFEETKFLFLNRYEDLKMFSRNSKKNSLKKLQL